jgi:hypothetical protein
MSKMASWYEPNELILLTGAGFTKSYGGYLTSEMWAAILNQREIQNDAVLRLELLNEFNFERYYHRVLSSTGYSEPQKDALTKAIRKAYAAMDDSIAVQSYQRTNLAVKVCELFLSRFAGEGKQRGFFFTLNQDLFVERYYHNDDGQLRPSIPGVIQDPKWFRGTGDHLKIDAGNPVVLPNAAGLEKQTKNFWERGHGQFKYIKLHGSYNWRSHGGSDALVIGEEKEGSIAKEPLLKWYNDLFEKVLSWPKKKILVVIGYSFRDAHINKTIADAIRAKVLQLCIVSPQLPQQFYGELLPLHGSNVDPKPEADCLWTGIRQYWPNVVTDFYDCDERSRFLPLGEAFFEGLRDSLTSF